MERFTDLNTALQLSWDLLYQAATSRSDPMRTPVLATFDGTLLHQRTIVLRKVEQQKQELFFFSDLRAPKVIHLRADPQLNALFYHPEKKVQLEVRGNGFIHEQDALSRAFWEKINTLGRSSYATASAPGTPLNSPNPNLPEDWSAKATPAETERYFVNFALIRMEVSIIDLLHLHHGGHQRALFSKRGVEQGGEWSRSWVSP